MQFNKRHFCLLFFVFCCYTNANFAQALEFGFGGGAFNYKGDLAPNYNFRNIQPSGELFFKYNIHFFLSLKAGLNYAKFGAKDTNTSDAFQNIRNFDFSGNLYDLSGTIEYNFFNFRREARRKWSPFIFLGIGGERFQIKRQNNQEVKREQVNQIVMPFGIGFKKKLTKTWNFNAEFRTIKTFGDKSDGFELIGNPSKFLRVNAQNEDFFYYLGVSLSYVYQGIKCPRHPAVR